VRCTTGREDNTGLETGLVNYYAGVRKDIFSVDDIMSAWKGRMAGHVVA